jgi:hypothetical protein
MAMDLFFHVVMGVCHAVPQCSTKESDDDDAAACPLTDRNVEWRSIIGTNPLLLLLP